MYIMSLYYYNIMNISKIFFTLSFVFVITTIVYIMCTNTTNYTTADNIRSRSLQELLQENVLNSSNINDQDYTIAYNTINTLNSNPSELKTISSSWSDMVFIYNDYTVTLPNTIYRLFL